MPIRYIWRTVKIFAGSILWTVIRGRWWPWWVLAASISTTHPCPNFVIIQEILHKIEDMTDTYTDTARLAHILQWLTQATKAYAASPGETQQRKAFILRTIISMADPSHPVRSKIDYRCSGSPSPPEELITAGWIVITGQLYVWEPLSSDWADCRDFPDKCAWGELVYPVGILTSADSDLFSAGQYLQLGCQDKTHNSGYKLQRDISLYNGYDRITTMPFTASFTTRAKNILKTPTQHVSLVGYISPQSLEGGGVLPCESVVREVRVK